MGLLALVCLSRSFQAKRLIRWCEGSEGRRSVKSDWRTRIFYMAKRIKGGEYDHYHGDAPMCVVYSMGDVDCYDPAQLRHSDYSSCAGLYLLS